MLDENVVAVQSIGDQITDIKTSLDKCCNKTIDLENRSRRNNLRITGIPEKHHETWEKSETQVKSTLREKLGLASEPCIERAHRLGRLTQSDESSKNSRFYDWKEKENILKQARIRKPSGIFVNEDVAEATMAKRREQLPLLRRAKQEGKIAYFVLDKLMIKNKQPGQS